jgi:hypothetical protein
MDTEAYLLARREIEGRLAAQRLRLFPEQGPDGARSGHVSWWPILARIIVGDTPWPALLGGVATAGAGYALSRIQRRFSPIRFVLDAFNRRFKN